jgi:hypothetical protein
MKENHAIDICIQEKKKHHAKVQTPNWLIKFENYYSDRKEGPYVLGNKVNCFVI